MNCQECQDVLDNMLVAEPGAAERAAFAEHLQMCPDSPGSMPRPGRHWPPLPQPVSFQCLTI